MQVPAAPAPRLAERCVLVVEDEYMIASQTSHALRALGASILGPAASVARALELIGHNPAIDAAVLDMDLRGERADAVADALAERGVPFVIATGFDSGSVGERHRTVPRREKPVDVVEIADLLFGQAGA